MTSKTLSTVTFATCLNNNCRNDDDDGQDDSYHDNYFGARAEVLFDVMDLGVGDRDRGGRVVRHHDEAIFTNHLDISVVLPTLSSLDHDMMADPEARHNSAGFDWIGRARGTINEARQRDSRYLVISNSTV